VTNRLKESAPRHPGATVRAYLEAHHLDQGQAARRMNISLNRVHDLINGRRSVSVDTAMRLSQLFPTTTPYYWLGLQNEYDVHHHEGRNGR
jgi:addiction module HigA family antidote